MTHDTLRKFNPDKGPHRLRFIKPRAPCEFEPCGGINLPTWVIMGGCFWASIILALYLAGVL